MTGAAHIRSEGNRHEYRFDAARINIIGLLEQVAVQTTVLDVETHRAAIDDIIANIYSRWQVSAK